MHWPHSGAGTSPRHLIHRHRTSDRRSKIAPLPPPCGWGRSSKRPFAAGAKFRSSQRRRQAAIRGPTSTVGAFARVGRGGAVPASARWFKASTDSGWLPDAWRHVDRGRRLRLGQHLPELTRLDELDRPRVPPRPAGTNGYRHAGSGNVVRAIGEGQKVILTETPIDGIELASHGLDRLAA